MENKDLRDKIIKSIPNLEPKFWSYHADALNEMNMVVWTYIHPNIRSSQPMAFACRSRNTTGVYEVYVNPNVPYECREPLELHEFGHVIFTHMSLLENQRKILVQKIMSYWNRFEKHIEDNALKTKEDIQKASKIICDAILNIAMDYEVNSKLFTDDEWKTFVEYIQWASIKAAADAPNTTKEELEKIIEWLDNKSEDKDLLFHPCWPGDEGFPKGLDYRQYIDLMLMRPDNAMDAIKKALGKTDSGSGDGNGSGSGKGNHGGKISKSDLEKILKEQNDANNEASNDAKEEAEKQDDAEQGTSSNAARDKLNQDGWSPSGHSVDKRIYDYKNSKALGRKILNDIINKQVLMCRQDNLYYYNRQKYNSNLLISKMKSEDLYRPGNIYLLVDCSCSIGSDVIEAIIGVVKNISKKCGPHSRIIWWDTALAGDYPLKELKGPTHCGGTAISHGIHYVSEKYLKRSNDKLIVLSDYEDSLHMWYDELEKIRKNDCLGICWGSFKGNATETIKRVCRTYDDNDEVFFQKFIKKLPTTLVDIGERHGW
jgi:predicted metal-dependent peptidase